MAQAKRKEKALSVASRQKSWIEIFWREASLRAIFAFFWSHFRGLINYFPRKSDALLFLQLLQGRFGSVFSGTFRFDKVAIKYFYPQCEDSFQNETAIFHKPTINLRDEHIVGFVASDIFHSPQGEIKRIIVMDFIPAGSLRDFMSRNAAKIDEKHSLKMCESLVKGVSFLHMEINGQQGKESIAHRDLSNTSVMVRIFTY